MHLSIVSWTQHTSIWRLVRVTTTSLERPRIVPTFRLPTLNFKSVVHDRWMTIWWCSGLTSALPCTEPSSGNPAPFTQLCIISVWAIIINKMFGASFYSCMPLLTLTIQELWMAVLKMLLFNSYLHQFLSVFALKLCNTMISNSKVCSIKDVNFIWNHVQC